MVEVEDISFVPKAVECSYKAISDNKYRYYNVKLFPASQCLPVSKCDQHNYKLYEDERGDGGSVEEAWSNGSAGRPRGVAGDVERKEKEDEATAMAVGDAEVADFEEAIQHIEAPSVEGLVQGQQAAAIPGQQAPAQVHAPEISLSLSEKERLRKGKGLLHPEAHGLAQIEKLFKPNLEKENSGSDSCEPGAQPWIRPEQMYIDDADSRAEPDANKGGEKEISPKKVGVEGGIQDLSAKEGEKEGANLNVENEDTNEVEMREAIQEGNKQTVGEGEETANLLAVDEATRRREGKDVEQERAGEGEEVGRKREGSRGSSLSIPPGFPKHQKAGSKKFSGAASLFGKL